MSSKTFKFIVLALVFLFIAAVVDPLSAQCAMCKASAEANLKAGGGDPKGLNAGILYMLMLPYLLVASIGFWWWRNRKKEIQQVSDLTDSDFQQP
ncbi:MAG: hypothetical protein IT262_16500 [Saprospiraceae bacterium]|nr:hypothetical protein [Saprospiraceae bacterium]